MTVPGADPAEPVAETITAADLAPSIIESDPPEHDRNREMMLRHFYGPAHSPHQISDLDPEIHRIVGELLDNMKGKTRQNRASCGRCRCPSPGRDW